MAHKLLQNKAYNNSGKLLNATYKGETWTTNTYIAERGEIEPRVNKSTFDQRPYQADKDNLTETPSLDPIIKTKDYEVQQITDNGNNATVTTGEHINSFQKVYVEYFRAKYPNATFKLAPAPMASLLNIYDNGQLVGVIMGLKR